MGEGHWHAPEEELAYLKYDLDEITYNPHDLRQTTAGHRAESVSHGPIPRD